MSEEKTFRQPKGDSVLGIGKSLGRSISLRIRRPDYEGSWREQGNVVFSLDGAEEIGAHLLSLVRNQREKIAEEERRKMEVVKSLEDSRREILEKRALLSRESEDDLQNGL